jgi:FAD/FMN-containing dehydrogenase
MRILVISIPLLASQPNQATFEALNPADVQAVVLFANACKHRVTARSGGHSYVGLSSCNGSVEACIQLDVSNLNAIDVSETQVSVGPGVKLEDLYPVLIANGIYLPSGELECL